MLEWYDKPVGQSSGAGQEQGEGTGVQSSKFTNINQIDKGKNFAETGIHDLLSGDDNEDSDYLVDEGNLVEEVEVDMRDLHLHVDSHIEFMGCQNNIDQNVDLDEGEVLKGKDNIIKNLARC